LTDTFGEIRIAFMDPESESVCFTTKGQVVIPARLRRQFHIEDGTRVIVQATPEGILLKPVTRHTIARLRGILKRKPGGKSFRDEWADHTRAEKALEDAKYERSTKGSR
jgi:AbrB family looped-hinge helix DNA binding protein